MKNLILGSFIALTVALLGWGATDNVNAVSPYDDVVQPVEEIYLISPDGSKHQSLTDWHAFITDKCSVHTQDIASMNDVIDNEQPYFIAVQSSEAYSGLSTRELVAVFAEDIGEISWKGNNRLSFVPTSTFGETLKFILRLQNNGSILCSNSTPTVGSDIIIAGKGGEFPNPSNLLYTYPFLVKNFDLIPYPPEYDGDLLPIPSSALDVYPDISIIVSDAVDNLSKLQIYPDSSTWTSRGIFPPDFSLVTVEDSDGIITPTNCFGFNDGCLWEKLPYGIYTATLNVVYSDPGVLDSYNFLTTVFVFEIHGKGYSILKHPDDGIYCSVMNGIEWNCDISQPYTEEKVTVTGYGSPLDWYECITPEFPYIDIDSCMKNVNQIINLLSFDTIQFSNNWSTNGCHTLGTLGDWLNLENSARTLCPQFSTTVRNIITPFITFFLATVTISFVVKKSEGEL